MGFEVLGTGFEVLEGTFIACVSVRVCVCVDKNVGSVCLDKFVCTTLLAKHVWRHVFGILRSVTNVEDRLFENAFLGTRVY